MGPQKMAKLLPRLADWSSQTAELQEQCGLVHGDFNNRNSIVNRVDGRWKVTGILDWELAFSGSPLWDAARFICYEQATRPCREPHFSNGFREGGGQLPEDWSSFARKINALSAAQSLNSADLPEHFVPELCELVSLAMNAKDSN